MGASCCTPSHNHSHDHGHGGHDHGHDHGNAARLALWIALILNAGMFVVELGAGLTAGSTSLLADSADFLGDAANYGLALAVLSMALVWRARVALLKGITMGLFGLWVAGMTISHAIAGTVPEPATMGIIGFAALAVNVLVTAILYRFRTGDSNMRAVWICSRNDALGNLAVMAAATGVFATGTAWPDLAVAAFMAILALWGSVQVMRQASAELRQERAAATVQGAAD
ncbi:cation transporter [Ferrovibrio sp.]|uniref:cation transporter n=1 Tax=Ferrovibrio sp. TaxID=1917215 RepID=UPI000CC19C77|nr:cation transporter [Ferrovibrio sp.]PJI40140.1 MAG: cation transporter [Ferrovibrio sp.]